MTTTKKARVKVRDCAECADPYDVKEMYPKDGTLICEPCFHDYFFSETE